mmetsp:Transcript_9721/g.24003  ORF Transcript_9721/g.24003 Transcript_9721/m.24003 type:complete len:251 (+) Transcript_9721:3487-4239(+)
MRRHPKAPGRHLLDGGALGVVGAVRPGHQARHVLAPLARVGLAAHAVHGAGQRGMRLQRDRPIRHGAGAETPYNRRRRLHRLHCHGRAVAIEAEHTSQVAPLVECVGDVGVRAELCGGVAARRRLQVLDGAWVVEVALGGHTVFIAAPVELPGVAQRGGLRGAVRRHGTRRVSHCVQLHGVRRQLCEPDPLHATRRATETLPHHVRVQPQRLENLGALIRCQRGDAHLGKHLEHPVLHRLEVSRHEGLCG